jgi:glycerol-3-phosphate dehydrogenase
MNELSVTMYAVVKDNIVVDCAVENKEVIVSPLTQVSYVGRTDVQLIEMTKHNSPAQLGMEYVNNKFIKRR